ncbi:hypothetical protein BGZ60DRAFT_518898 [Tricladium varicosporioides]|nr:hypothetical protein BGZ60DRAFT_518898 [Hymenoscyphus varicosporioides]
MTTHQSYTDMRRETRKAEAEKTRESHELAIRRPVSGWKNSDSTTKSPTTGLFRSSQQSGSVRRMRLQRKSLQRLAVASRPEPKYRSPSKNFYQLPTDTGMSSIPEDQVRHTDVEQKRMLSPAILEKLMHSASEEELLECSRWEVVRALFSLRNEHKKLKHTEIPLRVSSLYKTTGNKFPSPGPSYGEQQEAALSKVRVELALVKKELEQEKMKATESEKQRKKVIKELAQMSNVHANPFDDQHFKEQVELLQHKIDHWVRNQEWKVAKEGLLNPRAVPKDFLFLRAMSPCYLDYITSPRGLERLVEAYIWQFAVQKIFGQSIWATSLKVYKRNDQRSIRSRNEFSALYFDLQQSIPGCQELVHDWRVAGARALAARESQAIDRGTRDIAIRDLRQELMSRLDDIAYTDLDDDSLGNLLGEMVDLDFEFAQQKPYYAFYPEGDKPLATMDIHFSPASMSISKDDSTKIIPGSQQSLKLILRPGLLKHGNSAGKKYHQGAWISNIIVEVMPARQFRLGGRIGQVKPVYGEKENE